MRSQPQQGQGLVQASPSLLLPAMEIIYPTLRHLSTNSLHAHHFPPTARHLMRKTEAENSHPLASEFPAWRLAAMCKAARTVTVASF